MSVSRGADTLLKRNAKCQVGNRKGQVETWLRRKVRLNGGVAKEASVLGQRRGIKEEVSMLWHMEECGELPRRQVR